jgi:hypothetical protein
MRISTLGNDKGNVVLLSLIFILTFSLIFLSFLPRVISLNRYTSEYKLQVIQNIEADNREIIIRYDLY